MNAYLRTLVIAGALIAAAAPSDLRGQVSVDVDVDAVSHYVWRGYTLADAFTLQPSLTLGFGDTGLALNVWGSAALQDRGADLYMDASDELDFTLSYDRDVGEALGLSLGFILYTFPNLDAVPGSGDLTKHSEEVYAGLSLDNPLAPSVTAYYDFGLVEGLYLEAGVAPELALGDGGPTLGLGASLGLSDYADSFGFNDAQLSASVAFEVGAVSIAPLVAYTYAADEVNPDNSQFWGGLSFSFSR